MYPPMRYPSEKGVETLPHVYLTSNAEQWNPNSFGDDVGDDQWFDAIEEYEDGALDDDDFFNSRVSLNLTFIVISIKLQLSIQI